MEDPLHPGLEVTAWKDGDTVRVTVEGVASKFSGFAGLSVGVEGAGWVDFNPGTYEVEVLKKAPPKVGDLVSSRNDLEQLPVGSVIENIAGRLLMVIDGGTVSSLSGAFSAFAGWRQGNPPYKIRYVPQQ